MSIRLVSLIILLLLQGCSNSAKTSNGNNLIQPIADGDINQSFIVNSVVQLDGSGSYDPAQGSLTYQWSTKSKPSSSQASLSNATAPFASATLDIDGDYIFQLVVNNGQKNSAPVTVTKI
jgi:hypothetical protein